MPGALLRRRAGRHREALVGAGGAARRCGRGPLRGVPAGRSLRPGGRQQGARPDLADGHRVDSLARGPRAQAAAAPGRAAPGTPRARGRRLRGLRLRSGAPRRRLRRDFQPALEPPRQRGGGRRRCAAGPALSGAPAPGAGAARAGLAGEPGQGARGACQERAEPDLLPPPRTRLHLRAGGWAGERHRARAMGGGRPSRRPHRVGDGAAALLPVGGDGAQSARRRGAAHPAGGLGPRAAQGARDG